MWNNLTNFWMVYMDDVATYLLSSTLVLTLLYVPYTLLLRKEHFFRQNRFTLLAILVLSLVLPFCDVHALYPGELLTGLFSKAEPTPEAIVEFSSTEQQIAPTTSLGPIAFTEAHIRPLGIFPWLCYLYAIGTLTVLVIRIWQFARMHHLIRKGCLWSDVEDGITIHCHADGVTPCSWMHHIVISEHDYRHHRHEILLHEKGHIRSRHSWDIVLLTLVQIIQWFNPFVYMLSASLRDIHEYEADDYVLRQGITASEYQTLLLKTAISGGKYTFANSFNCHTLKNRIIMMKNKVISPWKRTKILIVLPALIVAVAIIAYITPSEQPYPIRIGKYDVKEYNISDFGKYPAVKIIGFSKGIFSTKHQDITNQGVLVSHAVEAFLRGGAERASFLGGFCLTEEDIDSVRIYFPGESDLCGNIGDNGILAIYLKRPIRGLRNYKQEKLEVTGVKSPYFYDDYKGIYFYNPTLNDSHIYMGYYYTASQLDSIFGRRTETIPGDRAISYQYGHEGVLITMTPADDMGLFSIITIGDKYRFCINGVEMQVGDNINRINWDVFNKDEEKVFEDGTVRRWYRHPISNDLLVVKHKNDLITEIRFDLDLP